MQPSPWPDWLNQGDCDLWAKRSPHEREGGSPPVGESLAAHTWLVLERLADLVRLRPQLAVLLHAPRLWHCLFWACFLHDLGKAARGFQQMLRHPDQSWPYRHEVLSLAFLDWIAHACSHEEQQWLVATIVSHHKEAEEIITAYCGQTEVLAEMVNQLEPPVVEGLWRWLRICSAPWISLLGLESAGVEAVALPEKEEALQMVCRAGPERIRTWLDLYLESLEEWRRPHRAHLAPLLVLLRGLLTTADHAASAHLARIPAGIPESWQHLERRLRPLLVARQWSQPGRADPQPYAYQRACAERARQSTLLIAPTGSGKTEAALYWALGDGAQPVPRLFYVLPYQASINAMYQRLSHPSYFGAGTVGLQHGHAFQALYQQLLATEMGPATAREAARWSLNLNRLHAYPLKVLSPYQLLKVLYRIKGFEGMLTDYTQALFIFDEIHAYDAERLALIVALLQYLQQRYGARMLIMSATLPSLVRQRLIEALALPEPIVAEAELLQRWRRHQLHLLDGDLLEEGWKRVAAQVKQGNMVMACCNTVGRAQRLYQQLRQVLAAEQVLLLHSRFTARDRQVREAQILERTGAGAARQALALVATQVVEVSLNLDVDTIYTDPAPLEALVQRFGRVNRAGSKGIVPVHVFRSPQDGQGIYLPGLVARTLSKLEEYQSQVIDEVALQHWLDAIYEDPELADPWQRSYGEQFELASWLLKQLRPFQAHAHGEEAFAQLFDGMEVLPGRLEQDYRDLLEAGELLEATQLCVPLSYRTYQALVQRHQVRHLPLRARARSGSSIPMVEAPYDPELGLVLPQDAIDRSGS
ncbi:CRISPR-associated helicase/endonuclease Cas3 [Thermogemmatispora onikobensis]|uniref:CRISPR-associated helicase/endonuclease Cas3 n=1 Tax=Thermogemmatispora onikobensis TaxID=732234 RepID=UPI000853825C|nr:CRISPR-associated helicase/endonuclease Cas3 [Thermogemmatispora onikobensis]